MKISDLYFGLRPLEQTDTLDPFAEAALEGLEVIDVRSTFRERRAGVILRGDLGMDRVNTVVVVAEGLIALQASMSRPSQQLAAGRHVAHIIGSWMATLHPTSIVLHAGIEMAGDLEIEARRFAVHFGRVASATSAPLDYATANDADIRSGVADWTSEFVHLRSAYIWSSHRA